MVGWRRRGWRYRRDLPVPADLDLRGLEATRVFLHRTVRADRSMLRRTVPINVEQVTVGTAGRGTFECRALPRALAVVEPPDEVKVVHLEIGTGRGGGTVVLDWRADGTSVAEVRGRSHTWVVGVHGVLGEFFDRRGYVVDGSARSVATRRPRLLRLPRPPDRSHRGELPTWLPEAARQVALGVVSSAVFGLLGYLAAQLLT